MTSRVDPGRALQCTSGDPPLRDSMAPPNSASRSSTCSSEPGRPCEQLRRVQQAKSRDPHPRHHQSGNFGIPQSSMRRADLPLHDASARTSTCAQDSSARKTSERSERISTLIAPRHERWGDAPGDVFRVFRPVSKIVSVCRESLGSDDLDVIQIETDLDTIEAFGEGSDGHSA
jgi:hypothetical protein